MIGFARAGLSVLLSLSLAVPSAAYQQPQPQPEPQPPASEVTPDPWPKVVKEAGATYTIYQPQVDSWDGYHYQAHAAVSVLTAGSQDPAFGAVELSAVTVTDRVARSVEFYNIQVTKSTFPSAPSQAAQYGQTIQMIAENGPSTMSLDRLQASLSILGYEKTARSVPVRNEPPAFVFSTTSAILILIDGQPAWAPAQGTSLQRLLNTRAMIVKDSTGVIYLHLLNGFVTSQTLDGPWTVAASVPPAVTTLTQDLSQKHIIDLLDGPPDDKNPKNIPTLQQGVPRVVMATKPTELIITQGAMDWAVLEGTNLLYVKNTTGNIFKDLANQQNYLLVTGRWFSAPDFSGPWKFVPAKALPADFANIPDDSPKENVKASIPGTPQARDAVISNEIPHTATVDRSKVQFTEHVSGAPVIQPITDTSLSYVFNSPDPIIRVSATQWYALQNGVWFNSTSALGPWTVAGSVPAVIYSIPPSSSLYYATYVKIYDATPTTVVVGYTPGYMGTVVSADGTVVYGTGYAYPAYVSSTVWYPPPVTYGYAASVTYTPWTGWAVGFGLGMAFGAAAMYDSWGWCAAPYWGAMPYAPYAGYAHGYYGGAAAWGPGGWAATSGNVYSHWGATSAVSRTSAGYNAWTGNAWSSQVGHSYNSVTGRQSVGERGAVSNVYTGNYAYGGRGATYNPTTGTAAAGSRYTVGNAAGQQTTVGRGVVSGPAGGTTHVAQVGNNYYADHDGNVYRNSGDGFQKYDNGSWNNVDRGSMQQSLQSEAQARNWGDQRSAGSSWGGGSDWGGDRSGGWDRGSGDRSWGGGGGRSWGGGGWGGGRSWGGGGFGGFRGRR